MNNAGVITAIEAALATANILLGRTGPERAPREGRRGQNWRLLPDRELGGQVLWNLDTTGDVRQTLSSLRVRDIYINNNANVRLTDGGNALQISGQVASPSYFSSTSPSTAFYASQNGGFCRKARCACGRRRKAMRPETAARVGYIGAGVVADARLLAFAELVFRNAWTSPRSWGTASSRHFVAGAGIVLQVAGRNEHRLTVSNAHALVITTL